MRLFNFILAASALLGCADAYAEHFKVVVPLNNNDEGAMALLTDFDTGTTIDSVLVSDAMAVFEGEIDEPVLARVTVDGSSHPLFILESGTISFGGDGAFGSMLNDQLRQLGRDVAVINQVFRTAPTETEQRACYERYTALLDSTLNANSDNALGYFVFINSDIASLEGDELAAKIAQYPAFADKEHVKSLLNIDRQRRLTAVGQHYVDFEVTYDGKTERLSDYVKPGKYTIVDFWASWCGPCMRQAAVLKDLYSRYADKGLNIVGVAVWDKPEDTLRAIKSHGLTWPNIINADRIPSELYGFNAIPCILLIGPDGTILSRGKQGDELIADVEAAMSAVKN